MKELQVLKTGVSLTTIEIAERTGKRHDNVLVDTRKILIELYGVGGILKFQETYRNSQNDQEYQCFRLPKREVMILVTGYSIPLRAGIIDRLEQLEKALKPALPDFTNPVAAAEAFIESYKAQQKLIEERDHAIKTKAQISDRKTATAMATASAKSKENDKLRTQLGIAKNYKQAKAIPWLSGEFKLTKTAYQQIGKALSRISAKGGYSCRSVEDTTYGQVKAYHVNAIEKFREELDKNPKLLSKYRRDTVTN